MARYSDQVTDQNLVPLQGVDVTVLTQAGGLASLTNDDTSVLSNPFSTGPTGLVTFNAPDGVYFIEYRYGGRLIREDEQIVGNPPQFAGSPGPSNNTRLTLDSLKSASIGDATSLYNGSLWTWTTGDFTGQNDDVNIVKANSTAINIGAWVRQKANAVNYDAAQSVQGKLDRIAYSSDARFAGGTKGDGVTDDTASLQAALNFCISNRINLILPPGTYMTTGLTATMTASPLNSTFQISGGGRRATRLRKMGTSNTPILTVVENYSDPSPTQLDIFDMEITGNGSSSGLLMQKVSGFSVRRVMFNSCTRAVDISGSLIGVVSDCDLNGSTTGIRLAKDTFFSGANHITIDNCRIKGNTIGADVIRGSRITFRDCDFEQNGTSGNQATGAVKLRSGYGSDIGFSGFALRDCWFEANLGWTIDVEDQSGANVFIAIDGCKVINNDATDSSNKRAIRCVGSGQSLNIINTFSGSPGDLWDITASRRAIHNSTTNKLSGSGGNADCFSNFTIGASPIEGNFQSEILIGGANPFRQTWALGASQYRMQPNTTSGDWDWSVVGTSARINAPAITFNTAAVQVAGSKVIGARSTAVGQAASASASPTQTDFNNLVNKFNALLSRLGATSGHGLTAD